MDDLIRRQLAIDVLRNYLVGKNVPCDGTLTCRLIENEVINKLPSARPAFDARDTQYNLPIGTDLISRQALLDKFEPWLKVKDYNDGELNMLKAILYEIRFMRSAQPEIIRCKDCKHWIPYDWMFSEVWQSKNIADYPEDDIGCDLCDMAMKANDFCSRAERRTE